MKVKDVKVVDSDYKKMVGQKNKIVKAVIIKRSGQCRISYGRRF